MITIEFNADAARTAIREAMAKLDDMTPIFSRVSEYMRASTEERFQRGVSPSGSAWAPKSAATLDRYRRLGYGNRTKPLIGRTGLLSSQVIVQSDASSATIGSNRPYAAVMQFGAAQGAFGRTSRGGPIPWGRIPARAWLGISTQDEREIVDIVEEQLASDLGEGS